MGQEAQCVCRFGRKTSKGKAHLASNALTFHGEFRLSIPLQDIKLVEAKRGQLYATLDSACFFHNQFQKKNSWNFRNAMLYKMSPIG